MFKLFKTADITFRVLRVLANQHVFCMMHLGDNKIRCLTLFYETNKKRRH